MDGELSDKPIEALITPPKLPQKNHSRQLQMIKGLTLPKHYPILESLKRNEQPEEIKYKKDARGPPNTEIHFRETYCIWQLRKIANLSPVVVEQCQTAR